MNLLDGLRCYMNGMSRATKSDVRAFVLIPALVSLVVVSTGIYFAFGYIDDLTLYLGQLGMPEFLEWIIEPLLYIFGVLLSVWLFGFVATLVGSPFLGDLNLKIDPPDGYVPVPWHQQIWPTVKRELRKLRYTLPRIIGLLLLSFVPFVNFLAPVFLLGYGGWLMAVQFCDFSFENRGLSFDETLATLRPMRLYAIGFGACVTFTMSIPLLNFVAAPVAVIGGAYCARNLLKVPA